MQIADLALQRNKYKHLSDEEWRWFLQQEEGRQRTADKLPSFALINDWWYPVRLSCEQCSSELTARYKTSIVQDKCQNGKCLDLTGGYGVDTYFLSEQFAQTDYVEQNEELCRIATHNFSLPFRWRIALTWQSERPEQRGASLQPERMGVGSIFVHNTTAEAFLEQANQYDLIFIDPARRDSHGSKVFRLADCTPNIITLLPLLQQHLTPNGRLMLKLSPMLDITQAVKELTSTKNPLTWDIHIVAVKNEVKEVLLLSHGAGLITAIDLIQKEQVFTFTREEEMSSLLSVNGPLSQNADNLFLYEPNAAILKAGAYKLIARRFGLKKADTNTHLYFSDTLISDFPGKTYKVLPFREGMRVGPTANVLVRNYPLTAEQLKKKLHLRDGGTAFIIGCRVAGKPMIFVGERV